jgi:hypothetical protein
VLDFRRTDAETERTQRTVSRGMRIAADDRLARQREAELRPDDVADALANVEHRDVGHAERSDIGLQRLDLQARGRVFDPGMPVPGRDVVVGDRERRLRPAHGEPRPSQPVESLRAAVRIEQMAIDWSTQVSSPSRSTTRLSQILSKKVRRIITEALHSTVGRAIGSAETKV